MIPQTIEPAPIPARKDDRVQNMQPSSATAMPSVPVFQMVEKTATNESEKAKAAAKKPDPLTLKSSSRNSIEEQKNKNALAATVDNIIYQRKAVGDHVTEPFKPIQKKENRTGLPDNLKSGIENLSGFSMDDVKVHYDSDKPAQLNALAYAQGTHIHVAAGQEKHLPHEAWHVVQQKQGRVAATMQMKGTAINDDIGLEKEADMMGHQAVQMYIVQRKEDSSNTKAFDPVLTKVRNTGFTRIVQRIGKKGVISRKEKQQKQKTRIWIKFGNEEKEVPADVVDKLNTGLFNIGDSVSCDVSTRKDGGVNKINSVELDKDEKKSSEPSSKKEKTKENTSTSLQTKERLEQFQQLLKHYSIAVNPFAFDIPLKLLDDIIRYLDLMLLLHNTPEKTLIKMIEGQHPHKKIIETFLLRLKSDKTFSQKPLGQREIVTVLELSSLNHPAVIPHMGLFTKILTGSVAAMNLKHQVFELSPPEKVGSPHALAEESEILSGHVLIFIHGSSIAGLRGRPKPEKGWIFDKSSDIDVAIVDPVRFSWAQMARITTYADNETVELNDDQLKLLGLLNFALEMRIGCGGREVNFSVYRTRESGTEHSGWSLSCLVNNDRSGPDASPVIENITRSFSTGSDPFALEHQNKTNTLGQGVRVLGYSPQTLNSLGKETKPEEIAHGKSLEEQKLQIKPPDQGNHLFNEPMTPMSVTLELFSNVLSMINTNSEEGVQPATAELVINLCKNLGSAISTLKYLIREGEEEKPEEKKGGTKEEKKVKKTIESIATGYSNLEYNHNAILYSNASVYFKNISVFLAHSISEVFTDSLNAANHFQNLRMILPLWLNSLNLLLDCSVDNEVVMYLKDQKKIREIEDKRRAPEALTYLDRFNRDKRIIIDLFRFTLEWLTKEAQHRVSMPQTDTIPIPSGILSGIPSGNLGSGHLSSSITAHDYVQSDKQMEQVKEKIILKDRGIQNLLQLFDLHMISGSAMNCLLRSILRGYGQENEQNVHALRSLIVSNTMLNFDEMIDVSNNTGQEVLRIIGKNFGACTVNIIQVSADGSGNITGILRYNLGSGGRPVYVLHFGAHFSYLTAKNTNPLQHELFKKVPVLFENISLNDAPGFAKKPEEEVPDSCLKTLEEYRKPGERGSKDSYTEVEIFREHMVDMFNLFKQAVSQHDKERILWMVITAEEWAEAILRRFPPEDEERQPDHQILIRMARTWLDRPDLSSSKK